ncbi:MAG: cyclic beta,2-glucan synthetase [Massilia sp.]
MNDELHTLHDAPHAGDSPVRTFEAANAAPLRAEVFGAAQMAQHGRALAARHTLAPAPGAPGLLARLQDNAAAIARVAASLRGAAAGSGLPPAAAALLRHQSLIDEQVRLVRRQLPKEAERALPCLAAPLQTAGIPRIYRLALEAVAHGDGRIEEDSLARLVAGYQAAAGEAAPLALCELRALPAMLRLALVENLRRLAVRLGQARTQRAQAASWAARMIDAAEARPGDLVLLMADLARQVEPMGAPFVAELARRLEGRDGPLAGVLAWLGTRLQDAGVTLAQQVKADAQDAAADAVSLANSLASLRLMASIDWCAFLEAASAVEQALRRDPAGVHPRMDAATRAHYRQRVERLAGQSGRSETQVALETLALAGAGADPRTRHVGHYLAGDGLPLLRARLGQRPGILPALRQAARRRSLLCWLGAVGTFTLLFTAALLVHAWQGGAGASLLAVLGVLAVCGASELALSLGKLAASRLVAPRPLPRLDFGAGIPARYRTLVAVPAVLDSLETVAALCRRLELHYLANRDPQLRFCLLADVADAPSETMPLDAELLAAARDAIAALNARYRQPGEDDDPFLLLQRRRVWSSSEGAWIARERRRGALADLHAWLRGGARERFAAVGGADGAAPGSGTVRYVLTLDADTALPRDAARRLVEAMAHPLNRPVLSADGRRVVAGHGLLLARVTRSLPLDGTSRYGRVLGGEPGIDPDIAPDIAPDAGPVPDLWQDLFGAGARGGQGIHDVDACARVLDGLPAASVLGHDLLAGGCLRAARLTDVQLYQPAPVRYRDDVQGRHRRLRGAWQLAGWLRTRVSLADGTRVPTPLDPLARWRLLDALRQGLVAPTLVAMLVLCWARLAAPAFWSAAALSVFFLPAFIGMLVRLADRPHDTLWRQHLANCGLDARIALRRAVMQTAFLPHAAWTGLDALARALWRMGVSRRRLLQWTAAGPVRPLLDIERDVRGMWFAPALAVGVAVLLSFLHPFALFAAAPLLLLWFLSPVIAWWGSLPGERALPAPAPGQALFLARVARRSWGFFETFTGPEHHWLPPAGMQEHPNAALEQRTSPTDIGVALLANLAAWDFGFLAQAGVLARVRAAFDSMALLARHRGHFCQGYDSRTLAPLEPVIVSTVESGNLAAHLLTLAAGLEGMADAPIAGGGALAGLRTTLAVVEEHAQDAPPAVREAIAGCRAVLQAQPGRRLATLPGLADCLQDAADAASDLVRALPEMAAVPLRDWCARFEADCHAVRDDLLALAPWMRAVQEYVLDAGLTRIPTLRELAAYTGQPAPGSGAADGALAAMVEQGAASARARLGEIRDLARRARDFADMDFAWLYRHDSGLLASGVDVGADALLDGNCELLASQARLASFVGLATGQLPQAHWFALKRPLAWIDGELLLLSHHGALADALAPLLVMPAYAGTLFDRTGRALVRAQVAWAGRHGLPWGLSDAGCNAFDEEMHYVRRPCGLAGAGIDPRAAQERVVAPYASMLALMVAPEAACANLERLAGLGCIGEHGFYEALDFTGARLPRGSTHATVRAFMARHQGMGLLALSRYLHGRPMERRFTADPRIAAALPLLYERVPKSGAFKAPASDAPQEAPARAHACRSVDRPGAAPPEVQLLSNGRYHVMVTSDGAGYSRWHELAVTRWRGDPTLHEAGLSCCLRDLDSGTFWSAGFLPAGGQPEGYEAVFSEGRAQFRRRDHGIELATDIVVASDDDAELRRMRIRNGSQRARRIELTSYAEIALAPPAAGRRPLHCELLAERHAVLATPHEADLGTPWLLHLMAVHGGAGAASFGAGRMQFAGPDGGLPAALRAAGPRMGGEGVTADPALAVRRVLSLAPGEEIVVDLVLGVAPTREEALHLLDRYGDRQRTEAAFELAWTRGQALLHQLGVTEEEAGLYARLAGAVLYPQRALRAQPAVIARNRLGQSALWPYGISGDLPIVLAQVGEEAHLGLVRQLLRAQAWWWRHGLAVDLVLWHPEPLRRQVARLLASNAAQAEDGPGGRFAFPLEQIPEEDRTLMQAVACVVLEGGRGSLPEQLERAAAWRPAALPPLRPAQPPQDWAAPGWTQPAGVGAAFDNSEYLVRTAPGQPVPDWPHLLASPGFATLLGGGGQGGTWSGDGLALTPPDAGPERAGEAFYLRDEDSGVFWSPMPLPAPSGGEYLARHGFGYGVCEHRAHGIHSETACFVALDAPLKYTVLRVRNDSGAPRRLSVTGYVEWVMGRLHAPRAAAALHVVTERDPASGALLARSAWNSAFAGSAGFFHVDAADAADTAFTCDRLEFIGRHGDLARPQALARSGLSGALGAAFDPCAALQVAFELAPGEERELVFQLGVRRGAAVIGDTDAAAALGRVRAWWQETLGALRIETPDPGLDLLVNGWLPYRAAAALWAGGAGMRARLQQALALAHARPALLREQLLLCAAQALAAGGDGHAAEAPSAPRDAGDLLWLPLAACRYLDATGDAGILGVSVPAPDGTAERADLYACCVRAIRQAMRFGAHGLPLALDAEADGEDAAESVWLGFFMLHVLRRFAGVADRRADYGFATTCRAAALALEAQAEDHAWDGARYRRGFGAGTGSGKGAGKVDEGPADLAVQSWSVLSGVAGPEQAAGALAACAAGLASGVAGASGQALVWAAAAFARIGQDERAWALLDAVTPLRRSAAHDGAPAADASCLLPAVPLTTPAGGDAGGNWYTVPAGEIYRLVVESLLGLERNGERLVLAPRLRQGWPGFRVQYRYRGTLYAIEVRAAEAGALLVDGQEVDGNAVQLVDDGAIHRVELHVVRRQGPAIAAEGEATKSK